MADRELKMANFDNINKSDWYEVVSASYGKAMAIQTAFGRDVVKGRGWNVDFSTGKIYFGEDEFDVEFIGSESNHSDSWLWGWENINGFPEPMVKIANEVKAFGEKHNLLPFTTASFDLSDTHNGHLLASAVIAMYEDVAYYGGHHDGGAVFMAVKNLPKEVFKPIDGLDLINTVTSSISNLELDHKIFLESLLKWNGTEFFWEGMKLTAKLEHNVEFSFELVEEDFLRICDIRAVASK